MANRNETSEVWRLYEKSQTFTNKIGLAATIKNNVNFYEGKQWATPSESTKTMPRPVVNLVKFICRNKRAMLTATPIRLVYKSEVDSRRANEYTRFASYVCKEMDMDELDSKAIRDAVIKGSYFYHLYWDSEKVDKKGIKNGGLRCEIIDPQNVFFSNPEESDEQMQEWIIISSAMPLRTVKSICDSDVDTDLIVADESSDTDEYCTILTRYFRINGEVYCEKAVRRTIVNKPFKITPENVADYKATMYPVIAGCYEEREKCIYGISEAEGLISDQKLVNHILGMEALAIQNIAWGKYIVSKDALRGQQISNEPGEILIDHSINGDGIRKLEQHSLSTMPLNFVNTLTSMLRTVSGATEVITGETLIGNMSGRAIAQLQDQANQPILDQRKRFWRTKQRFGKVLAQCFRLYYDKRRYFDNGEEKEFVSAEYDGIDMEVTVEAVGGASGSVAGDINLLETLYQKGDIDAETFVEAYPNDMILEKQKILDILKSKETNSK